jgi:phenylpyruvate tautomerase PptA (4-oxalocrotonate tautomerase family)
MFRGRSMEAKRRLYHAVVSGLEAVGVQPDDVVIVIHEPPMENWGVEGGVPASEVELPFRVDV